MSTVAKLARWSSGSFFPDLMALLNPDQIPPTPEKGDLKPLGYGEGYIMVETEVFNPPSMEGRKIWVALDEQDVTDLLLVLRREAIAARSKPM